MNKPVHAYLIGGPFDLTKRTVSESPDVLRMVEIPVTYATSVEYGMTVEEVADTMTIHLYRKVGRVEPPYDPCKAWVYVHEGIENGR